MHRTRNGLVLASRYAVLNAPVPVDLIFDDKATRTRKERKTFSFRGRLHNEFVSFFLFNSLGILQPPPYDINLRDLHRTFKNSGKFRII